MQGAPEGARRRRREHRGRAAPYRGAACFSALSAFSSSAHGMWPSSSAAKIIGKSTAAPCGAVFPPLPLSGGRREFIFFLIPPPRRGGKTATVQPSRGAAAKPLSRNNTAMRRLSRRASIGGRVDAPPSPLIHKPHCHVALFGIGVGVRVVGRVIGFNRQGDAGVIAPYLGDRQGGKIKAHGR